MTDAIANDCAAPCCGCAEMRLSLPAGRPVCRLEIQYGEPGCVRVARERQRERPARPRERILKYGTPG